MKVSELKQLIKEEIVKVLTENSSNPAYKSTVDWYYVTNSAHKSGATVAHDPKSKYDAPKGDIYIKKGTVGYKDGNEFRDEDDNTVEFKDEYFEKISENSVNEEKYAEPIVMIQNIVDNWSDGGIDAEAAMTRIDKILIGNYEDESGEGFDN